MSYAPNAVILTGPSPADSGLTLEVGAAGISSSSNEGMGDAFPGVPFLALVWVNQQYPVLGTNAMKITVTARVNDLFTFVRGTPNISIQAGMRVAALRSQDPYSFGDYVALSDPSFSGSAPFTFRMRDPGGYSYTEARASAGWAGTAGAGHLTRKGQYYYQFSDVNGFRSPEQDFFIRFTEVG